MTLLRLREPNSIRAAPRRSAVAEVGLLPGGMNSAYSSIAPIPGGLEDSLERLGDVPGRNDAVAAKVERGRVASLERAIRLHRRLEQPATNPVTGHEHRCADTRRGDRPAGQRRGR